MYATELNVEAELRAAAAEIVPLLVQNRTRIDVAVRPGLTLRANRSALREILHAVLRRALQDAATEQLLLTAAPEPGRVRIAITDDAQATATAARQAALRDAAALLAIQGGSMHIDVRPGQGTIVALYWPAPLSPVASRESRSNARDTPEQPALRPEPIQIGDF
ncbi:MAG: hypothetical protein WCI94_13075 [Rhodospirillales bacterium]